MKTFEEHLTSIISQSNKRGRHLAEGECQSPRNYRCTLCHAVNLTYDNEVDFKNEAVHSFWKENFSGNLLSPLVPSPMGRGYRTVTKRRAFHDRESIKLGLIAPTDEGSYKPFDVVHCAIEPAGHAPIYQKVQGILEKPYAAALGEVLSYVIIKGSYTEHALIFNVRDITPNVVRAANTMSKTLTHTFKEISGIFLYEDSSSGRYYLGRSNKDRQPTVRKIFGKGEIFHRTHGKSFIHSLLEFSQVNQSIVETFVTHAGNLLDLNKNTTLFDLYCGYGLFSLCFAEKVRSVVGVEISVESVASAIANAKRQKVMNARFVRGDIIVESVARLMQQTHGQSAVLLDPPRSGTGEGVIECIAARKPERVLHIFCNSEIVPAELKRWTENGYTMTKAIPFDMFPGTSSIEIMVLLERKN